MTNPLAPVLVLGHAPDSAAAPASAAALTATGRSAARPHSAQLGNASPGVNMGRHTRFEASSFAPSNNRSMTSCLPEHSARWIGWCKAIGLKSGVPVHVHTW